MCEYWRDLKFVSGFLTINFDDERVIYKEGKTGYIINFEYRIMVNENIEVVDDEEVEIIELEEVYNAFLNIAKEDSNFYEKEIEIFFDSEFLKTATNGEDERDARRIYRNYRAYRKTNTNLYGRS